MTRLTKASGLRLRQRDIKAPYIKISTKTSARRRKGTFSAVVYLIVRNNSKQDIGTSEMSFTVRQSEYTGENRCTPCTALNVTITILLAVGISTWLASFSNLTRLQTATIGGVFTLVSLVIIYMRGYLLPGTPQITARYFPDRLLSLFGKDSWEPISLESTSDINPEEILLQSGLIAPCPDEDDLCLAPEFRRSWNTGIESIRDDGVDPNAIAENVGVAAGDCTVTDRNGIAVVRCGSTLVGRWPSQAALLADAAAATELSSYFENWNSLSHGARREILYSLRLFLEDCPTDDGGVTIGKERVHSTCCGTTEILAVSCREDGDRLFEGVI